jgi:hypothetical protein
MERGALEGSDESVAKRVCLPPVTLPPEGSRAARHRVNPGKAPRLTRHPPARLRKRRQGDGRETDRRAARVARAQVQAADAMAHRNRRSA